MNRFAALLLSLAALSMPALAQSGKRAAAVGAMEGLGKSLSEMAQRQMDLESEIQAARAKAAIELDLQRKLAADREARKARASAPPNAGQAAPGMTEDGRREIAILDRSYPAWFEHTETQSFKRWMAEQSADVQARFSRVQKADELLGMINDHRLSLGMEPVKLQR